MELSTGNTQFNETYYKNAYDHLKITLREICNLDFQIIKKC